MKPPSSRTKFNRPTQFFEATTIAFTSYAKSVARADKEMALKILQWVWTDMDTRTAAVGMTNHDRHAFFAMLSHIEETILKMPDQPPEET